MHSSVFEFYICAGFTEARFDIPGLKSNIKGLKRARAISPHWMISRNSHFKPLKPVKVNAIHAPRVRT